MSKILHLAADQGFSSGRRKFAGTMLGLGAAAALPAAPARAQSNWPDKPIRLLVGYPPGGGTDSVARIVAQQLSQVLGQSVVVENRAGAGGVIATDTVVRSAPDGYTLIFSTASPLTGAPLTVKGLTYDPFKQLAPVTFIGGGPFLMVAYPGFPPNNLKELVEYARAHPGEVNFGSPGIVTANHFFGALLNIDANIKTVLVPYKGAADLLKDVMGGMIQFTLDTPGTSGALIKQGKMKALCVFSEKRIPTMPDVPTAVEQGFDRLVGGSWYGILAPAGTPEPIVQRLHEATVKSLAAPSVVQALAARDVTVRGLGPKEFGEFIKAEYLKWKEVTEKAGIRAE